MQPQPFAPAGHMQQHPATAAMYLTPQQIQQQQAVYSAAIYAPPPSQQQQQQQQIQQQLQSPHPQAPLQSSLSGGTNNNNNNNNSGGAIIVPADASPADVYDLLTDYKHSGAAATAGGGSSPRPPPQRLPPGWERVTYRGTTVYIDHIAREAHEEVPWEVWRRRAEAVNH